MTKKRKKKKRIIFGIIILLFIVGLALWKPRSKADMVANPQILQEIQSSLQGQGKIILNQGEINFLLKEYIKGNKKIEDFTIEEMKIEIPKNDFDVHATIKYKGISFLVTTQGQVSYSKPFIEYKINKIHLGKLPIPKEIFFMLLNAQKEGKIIIEKQTVKIDKKYLFLPIDSLKVQEGKLILEAKKKGILDGKNLKKPSKKQLEQGTIEALDKVLEELDYLEKDLKDQGQKEKVNKIQQSIEKFIKNPNQEIAINQEEIKDLLDSLTFQQKIKIYSAISSKEDLEKLLK